MLWLMLLPLFCYWLMLLPIMLCGIYYHIYIVFVADVITTLYMAGVVAMVADGTFHLHMSCCFALYITYGTANCDS